MMFKRKSLEIDRDARWGNYPGTMEAIQRFDTLTQWHALEAERAYGERTLLMEKLRDPVFDQVLARHSATQERFFTTDRVVGRIARKTVQIFLTVSFYCKRKEIARLTYMLSVQGGDDTSDDGPCGYYKAIWQFFR